MKVSGNIVDVLHKKIFPGTLKILNGGIIEISENKRCYDRFIIPGFVDSHVHIESSMLVPSEFSRIAVIHGTLATVSDTHEISNVLGVHGVSFMIRMGQQVPFKFSFGAPSCVPASPFETSGATIGPDEVNSLLSQEEIGFLGEVMNVSGVLTNNPDVLKKIESAVRFGKPIDGHAPGLQGKNLVKYVSAGISTDHETLNYEEGREKLSLGMKLLIREGSAAGNMDILLPLINEYPDLCMFCSDDKHPNDLITGHINVMVKKAIQNGIDVFTTLQCACINPVSHYRLPVGLLHEGDPADFLVIDNLKDFTVHETYINGILVAKNGKTLINHVIGESVNNISASTKSVSDFVIQAAGDKMKVIQAIDGNLITETSMIHPKINKGCVVSDISKDILEIAVVNRYADVPPAIGFVKNFGFKRGALASSVAHDSHNIVAVGVDDESLCRAVNLIIRHHGGIALADGSDEKILPLPVAGIMSNADGWEVANHYKELDQHAKNLGSRLRSPFMTLSFMTLPVIPKLKLTDKGLFDGERYTFTNLFGSL